MPKVTTILLADSLSLYRLARKHGGYTTVPDYKYLSSLEEFDRKIIVSSVMPKRSLFDLLDRAGWEVNTESSVAITQSSMHNTPYMTFMAGQLWAKHKSAAWITVCTADVYGISPVLMTIAKGPRTPRIQLATLTSLAERYFWKVLSDAKVEIINLDKDQMFRNIGQQEGDFGEGLGRSMYV